jgi:hypothetical protein
MHTLSNLKKFFETNGLKIKEFGGWYLDVADRNDGRKKDRWTLVSDIIYKNNEPIVEKDLIDSFKKPKK